MKLHKVIQRQLKKHKLRYNKVPQIEDWRIFLDAINKLYLQGDSDRYLLERSLKFSSQEMKEKVEKNKTMAIELAQAAKLASIGTLASGIAHELNNPLQIMNGYIELIKLHKRNPEKILSYANNLHKTTARMAETIEYMLNLSRKNSTDNPPYMDLKKPVKEVFEIMKRQLQYDNIELLCNFEEEDHFVYAHSSQIAGVLHNLISNSRDAFLSNIQMGKTNFIKVRVFSDNHSKVNIIDFEDNAGGIPHEVIEQIFDPFFTTKEVGKGTGLGLSLSKRTIEDLNGDMCVSVQDDRTRFVIKIPIAMEIDEVSSISMIPIKDRKGDVDSKTSHLRLLVVDDEPEICNLLFENLSRKWDVVALTDSEEALSRIKNDHFDMLITDLRMPKVSGDTLIDTFQKQSHKGKIVVLSGHIAADTESYSNNCSFIKKPFPSMGEFENIIANLLAVS